MLQPKTATTFQEYFDKSSFPNIKDEIRRVDSVGVVWDTYIAQSLKDEMRRVDSVDVVWDTYIAQSKR